MLRSTSLVALLLAPAAGAFLVGGRGLASRSQRAAAAPVMELVPGETCTGEKVAVVGATGYIGKAVVRDLVRRGYPTSAVVRDAAAASSEPKFEGATIVQADVCNPANLAASAPFAKGGVDIVISCLASRSGSKSDSFAIDYQATLNCLNAAREAGARHFVMLSAFCVKSAERQDPCAARRPARRHTHARHHTRTPALRTRPVQAAAEHCRPLWPAPTAALRAGGS